MAEPDRPASVDRGRPGGTLIALEGIDGCGKSTQTDLLAAHLGAVATREPGATALGAALRRLLLEPSAHGPVPRAEALLVAADRAQHMAEVVEPALRRGSSVVTDRFSGSTLAYQGFGRGLEVEDLRWLTRWACAGRQADLSILIDVPVQVARRRLAAAGGDRLESLDEEFHGRVREGFLALAAGGEGSWAVVDGTPPADVVARAVDRAVKAWCDRR